MPEVLLRVDGQEWGGWKSYSIQLGMRQLAGQFTLALTEHWAGQASRREIPEGAPCELYYDGDLLVTGYIDAVNPTYNAKEHQISVTGRDKTCDLIDCSAPPTQFAQRGLVDVARELSAPFGIQVIDKIGANAPFRSVKPNDGEKVFDVLNQLAAQRGVLLVTDGKGNLVITRADQERAHDALVLGENILSGTGSRDLRNVFSHYSIKGQQPGTDQRHGKQAASVAASATDTRLKRKRPLTLISETPLDEASARIRVEWERNSRWGSSQTLTYKLTQHRQSNGELWRHGLLVGVSDTYQYLKGAERLITAVTYNLDSAGAYVQLTLQPREALDILQLPKPENVDAYH